MKIEEVPVRCITTSVFSAFLDNEDSREEGEQHPFEVGVIYRIVDENWRSWFVRNVSNTVNYYYHSREQANDRLVAMGLVEWEIAPEPEPVAVPRQAGIWTGPVGEVRVQWTPTIWQMTVEPEEWHWNPAPVVS